MANLLSNLVNTKPKWQSEKAEVRREALIALTDDNCDNKRDDILSDLAANDPDARVRQTAIEQLDNPERLAKLASTELALVQKRLLELCAASPTTAENTVAAVTNNQLLLALVEAKNFPDICKRQAAEKLSDSAKSKALTTSDSSTRQLLLNATDDFVLLSKWHAEKPGVMEITTRLDALAANSAELAQHRADQLILRLDNIVKHGHWNERQTEIDATRQSWRVIQPQASDDAVERMARVETMLNAAMATKQDLQSRTKPDQDVVAIQQGKTDVVTELATLADSVESLTTQPEADALAQLTDQLHELTARWKTLDDADQKSTEFEQQMQLERYTQKRDAILKHLDFLADSAAAATQLEAWLNETEKRETIDDLEALRAIRTEFKQLRRRMVAVPPDWITRGEAAIKRFSTGLEDSAAARDEQIKTLKKTVADLQQSLTQGESAKAAQLYQQACQLLSRTPLAEGGKKTIEAKLKKAQRELKEINKWAHWAHNKDRRKLCDELEALAKDNTPAPEKLTKLQVARKEWQELEASEFTQNEHAAGKELWGRFNAAANKVYAACEAYVKKRDANQGKTLQHVQKRLDNLQKISAEDNDERLREHTKTANQLRRALRSLSDLPPNQRGATAKQIKATLNSSQEIINDWQDRNAKRKQRVIELTKQAANERELETALSKTKALQNDWKTIGPAARKVENTLWDEFKALTDTVYARLNEKRDAERSELNQVFDKLRTALKEAQTALQQPDDALNEAKATFKKSESVFDEHGLRHKVADAIRRDFDRCKRDFDKRLRQQRQAKQKQQLNRLADVATLLNTVELDLDQQTVQTEAIELAIAELNDPKLTKAMQKRWDKIDKTGQHADNTKTLQALALEMEILADIETPAAFKADRMALQVQRLSNAFGGQSAQASRTLKQCEQEWYTIGPVTSQSRATLEKRLENILRSKK